MVVCPTDHSLQADVIFVIEGTAVSGAYINDLKTNYIIPSLEYFSQGNIDETNYVSENANALYGIVVYQAADCLPQPSSDTIGPFSVPSKVLSALDKLELIGGKGESCANIAEGLATALQCFEELQQKREASASVQKHCILVCNSPPYLLPVLESQNYSGKTAEQLATILQEKGINLSIVSPKKIPSLYKLFEKAGGDLTASQTKNYAKDPRHLVLLKGFSLKERPVSPPVGSNPNTIPPSTLPITSLPSPLPNNDSPMAGTAQSLSAQGAPGVSPVYRPPSGQGMNPLPQHSQPMVTPGMVNVGMANTGRAMMANNQLPMQQLPAPPGYNMAGANRPPRWPMMPPQVQRQPYIPQKQVNTTQGSALIAQLTQPPSSVAASGVNQFGQMGNNSPMNPNQQQQMMNMNMMSNQQQNVQTSLAQNPQGSIQQQTSNPSQVASQNQAVTSQAQSSVQNPQARERHTIWQGLLEWIEKPKNATSEQKTTKHVPCQVSANSKDGEPELNADAWPPKLIMQIMPKQLIGSIGGAYLKNSKSVFFTLQNCEALESLTKVMMSGFAGCVHFTSVNTPPCDIKVLILLYIVERRAYLGFIPNDQTAFVDRLRKVIQQQKSNQMMLKQSQGGAPGPSMSMQQGPSGMSNTPPQLQGPNTPTSQTTTQQQQQQQQQQQSGLMMPQTNTMAMAGGQITQNVVSSSGQPGAGIGGVMGQNVPGGAMQPRIRMQGLQQGMGPQPSQQPGQSQPNMTPGMMGTPVQRAPFETPFQLQVERQQNLEKINQLKQTLEAAQQQEQQYKSQLERISHMKTSQLQEALQMAQQQEMQYQRMANQGNPAGPAAQQQQQQQPRMMRPVMANNPGLRHLLQQQQPQYRQMMGMQGMGGNAQRPPMAQQMPNTGNNQQNTFDDVNNFDFM